MEVNKLFKLLLTGDRRALAQAITLVESNLASDRESSRSLVNLAIPHSGNSLRIGITGRPGAGKSTFIETYGLRSIKKGHKLAVLAIDPSSSLNKGSLLGDKTRMEQLSTMTEAFIRPSATGGVLGGVSRKTREAIILCEAAGYDRIIVETVGVGQSEAIVTEMVDVIVMLELPFAGDEVQFIKKGLAELVDLFIVHKYDGERIEACKSTAHGIKNSLAYARKRNKIERKVICISSLTMKGFPEFEKALDQFVENSIAEEFFVLNREQQTKLWLDNEIDDLIKNTIKDELNSSEYLQDIQKAVYKNTISPVEGAKRIVRKVLNNESN